MLLWVFACGTSTRKGDPPSEVLAPLTDLEFLEAEDDPFSDHRPSEISCNTLTGYYREADALEVSTARCNYLSVAEPAHVGAEIADVIEMEISHFDLAAPEPATAHVALFVREHVLFEQLVEIPGPGQVILVSVALPVRVEVGDRVGIHLHNHGQNTWNFGPVTVTR